MADLGVEIGLLRADNLPAADYNGLSDPYVMVYFGAEDVARSSTKSETLTPIWNEKCEVSYLMYKTHRFIVFEVWDSDTMSKDDKLGECRLFLPEVSGEYELELRGSLSAHLPVDAPRPTLTISVNLPENLPTKEDVQPAGGRGMPGSSMVGSLMREILPSSEVWPGHGRCRIVPHSNEVVLEVVPHIVVSSDPRNSPNEMSPRNHGSLMLTQFRLVFIPVMFSQAFAVSLPAIQTIERHSQGSGRRKVEFLELIGKQSTYFRFGLIPMLDAWNHERGAALDWMIRDIKHRCQENQFHLATEELQPPAWKYNPHLEFCRMVFIEGAFNTDSGHPLWRETALNHDYQLCPTYPRTLIVPKHMDDDELYEAAQHRSKQRLPVLTWVHPASGGLLCRCSQPMSGLAGKNNSKDEKLLLWIRQAAMPLIDIQVAEAGGGDASKGLQRTASDGGNRAKELHVIDCRSDVAAAANKWLGKGTENTSALARSDGSDRAKLHHANIGNIHDMRNALRALTKALGAQNCGSGTANATFAVTEAWLDHNRAVLAGSNKAAALMHKGHAVLVHCSDGWDRTSQVCALSELLVDPFYRTFEGFATLIEKDWLSFGHMFQKRCGNPPDDESSPIFLQWIDCVWQLTQSYPKAFEFNEMYLLMLVDACYSGVYGTFRGCCEKEREELRDETHSVWDHVTANHGRYINPLFSCCDDSLQDGYKTKGDLLQANLQKITLWPALYRSSFGRNFVSNEALIEYHSTLQVLAHYLGDGVVEAAKQITQHKLKLMGSSNSSGLPEGEGQLSDACQGLIAQMQNASDGLSAQLAQVSAANQCESFESVADGSDERVNSVVSSIVGHDLWHMNECSDVRLNMSMTSIPEDNSLNESTRSVDCTSPLNMSMTKPYWVPDESVDNCAICTVEFSFMKRRHHCRGCGKVFCDKCSNHEAHVPWREDGPHRVCDACSVTFSGSARAQ